MKIDFSTTQKGFYLSRQAHISLDAVQQEEKIASTIATLKNELEPFTNTQLRFRTRQRDDRDY